MGHIESSVRMHAGPTVSPADVKHSLVQRMRSAFHVETVGDGVHEFPLVARGKSMSYVFSLNVQIKAEGGKLRVIIDGDNQVSIGTRIFYVISLLLVLALSLFPGNSENGSTNMILIAIFFLVVGGFIIHDMNRKFEEPQMLVDRIMRSLDAEFG